VLSIYIAFLSALALWGWVELAFLTGVITGPVQTRLKDGIPESEQFFCAWARSPVMKPFW
jgi:putative photosynthetic complex assembly protein 2